MNKNKLINGCSNILRNSFVCIISFLLIFLACSQLINIQAQGPSVVVCGVVLDEHGQPVPEAIVAIVRIDSSGRADWGTSLFTDYSGRFHVDVYPGHLGIVVAADRPETPGWDYVPTAYEVELDSGATLNISVTLQKGASIMVQGYVWFIEEGIPVTEGDIVFIVAGLTPFPDGGIPIGEYGGRSDTYRLSQRMGLADLLPSRLIIVPADTEVNIWLSAYSGELNKWTSFNLSEVSGYIKLDQGDLLTLDVTEYSILYNIGITEALLNSSLPYLEEAEDAGFFVASERHDLQTSQMMMESSQDFLQEGTYDQSFVSLRKAYLSAETIKTRLQSMITIGSLAAFPLMFFFVCVASAAAYLITERKTGSTTLERKGTVLFSPNLLVAAAIYAAMITTFFSVFPGCRLVPQTTFTAATILAFVIGQTAIIVSPLILSEKKTERRYLQFKSALMTAFSMGCRNLRRRRMRTTLSLINITILVFGFIAFTSVGPACGLITWNLRPSRSMDALVVRNERLTWTYLPRFAPLSQGALTWLSNQPNVTVIAPKAENLPVSEYEPLGHLNSSSGKTIHVLGILGVVPSVEVHFNLLNNTVVKGEFLSDGDTQGILISISLQKALDVDLGDTLSGFAQEFGIRGFFNPQALERWDDVDGQPIIPDYLRDMGGEFELENCQGNDVIIMVYERALTLPGVYLSRVAMQLENVEEYSSLAEIISFSLNSKVYISHPGSLIKQFPGGYTKEEGTSLIPFILTLVILNIAASMLGSMMERKNEISSLSSMGLSPNHIAALFIAEAAVIGFVGSGFGYLLGLAGYRMAGSGLFGELMVQEKVGAEWGLAALLVSILTSVFASLIPALKASTLVTPSLLRKWRLKDEEKTIGKGKSWLTQIPIKIKWGDVDSFIEFLLETLQKGFGTATNIRLEEEETSKGPLKRVRFRYAPPDRNEWTENEIVVQQAEPNIFGVELGSVPSENAEEMVYQTGTYVRRIALEWNATK
ncbi:MAG: hypothetical protein NWF14_08910 [Candidatus Bathyarchaeota archaeon]|nr:hypothetical protein [Candidatus Bathyarchaeota archaeon]